MCVGVTLWFGCGDVVSVCRLLQPAYGYHITTAKPQRNTSTHRTRSISRKLLRMDVLTSKTCGALNKEIIKQVTSSWSFFTQLSRWCTVQYTYDVLVYVHLLILGDCEKSYILKRSSRCVKYRCHRNYLLDSNRKTLLSLEPVLSTFPSYI